MVTLLTSDLPLSVFSSRCLFFRNDIIISEPIGFWVEIWPKKKCTEPKSKIALSKQICCSSFAANVAGQKLIFARKMNNLINDNVGWFSDYYGKWSWSLLPLTPDPLQ